MNKTTQRIFRNAVDHIDYTFDSLQFWEFTIKHSRGWDKILKDDRRIWMISDWVVFINSILERIRFNIAVKKNLQTICDFYERIIEAKKEKIDTHEKEIKEIEWENETLKKENEDLKEKIAKAVCDDIEESSPKRRNRSALSSIK